MNPVIVLVGRPNVGKSTLFNRLTQSRRALVHDQPGVTRDRCYAPAKFHQHHYVVVDTGGFEVPQAHDLTKRVVHQVQVAILEADAVFFVVDGRSGMIDGDVLLAQYLRTQGRLTYVVVNKTEGFQAEVVTAEFYRFGFGKPYAISAEHGHRVTELLTDCFAHLCHHVSDPPLPAPATPDQDSPQKIRIAVVGRPNVGKSSFINVLLGEERLVVSEVAGTTRDPIEIECEYQQQACILLDTAGLRRRATVQDALEKFSIIKTLRGIESAHVVLLMLDATTGVIDQDLRIANYIVQAGKSVVVCINKCDVLADRDKRIVQNNISRQLHFLDYAHYVYTSMYKKTGVQETMKFVLLSYSAAFYKMPTPRLTKILQQATLHQQPPKRGLFRPRLKYAHQGGSNPPTIVIHGNALAHIPGNYQRYLIASFREAFSLRGTPLRIFFRSAKNPYLSSSMLHKKEKKITHP